MMTKDSTKQKATLCEEAITLLSEIALKGGVLTSDDVQRACDIVAKAEVERAKRLLSLVA
jgi:hypothetical protein